MKTTNRFARGSGLYTCRVCGRKTRSTGRGDNEMIELCAECYDLGGEENSLSDYGGLSSSPDAVLALIASVAAKGGDTSNWDDLKAAAEKAKSTKE